MSAAAALAQARAWDEAGDPRAEAGYRGVLEQQHECIEARLFLARAALARDEPHAALAQLQQACRSEPDNPQLLKHLAVVAEAAGYPDEARQALEYAVRLAPNLYPAHLQLGRLLERAGERQAATRAYFRALTRAQFDGHWLDADSTEPRLREQVAHAAQFVRQGRTEVLAALMEPLHACHSREAMRLSRAACMAISASTAPRRRTHASSRGSCISRTCH